MSAIGDGVVRFGHHGRPGNRMRRNMRAHRVEELADYGTSQGVIVFLRAAKAAANATGASSNAQRISQTEMPNELVWRAALRRADLTDLSPDYYWFRRGETALKLS
jgi:hypothetical protein